MWQCSVSSSQMRFRCLDWLEAYLKAISQALESIGCCDIEIVMVQTLPKISASVLENVQRRIRAGGNMAMQHILSTTDTRSFVLVTEPHLKNIAQALKA